jgi:hypothetical protein
VVSEYAQVLILRGGQWVVAAGKTLKVNELETGIIVRIFHDGFWIDFIDVSGRVIQL